MCACVDVDKDANVLLQFIANSEQFFAVLATDLNIITVICELLEVCVLLSGFTKVADKLQVFSCQNSDVKQMQFGLDGSVVKLITSDVCCCVIVDRFRAKLYLADLSKRCLRQIRMWSWSPTDLS